MKMWNKFKTWIIHKLGGRTQKEYDTEIKKFKVEYDMAHPAGIRYIDRYPRREIFKYDFILPDKLVYDMDEFLVSKEFRKIRDDIVLEMATALLAGNHVRFETCKDLQSYGKKIRATLDVLKWEE